MITVTPGMRRLCASVLGMEAIVLGLFTPTAINVQGVEPVVAVTVGIGLAVLCVLVTGMLKRPFAYIAGKRDPRAGHRRGLPGSDDVRPWGDLRHCGSLRYLSLAVSRA